jgi:hypothetical protein
MPKFKSKWADLVVEVGAVSIDIFTELYHEFVVSHVKKVSPDVIDISLLRALCNWLENAIDKKDVVDEKLDKKKIVVDEYIRLKPQANTQQFKDIIEKLIDDLHNTQSIKKISKRRKMYHRVKSCFVSNDANK